MTLALASAGALEAAETRLRYDFGLSETYSEDVLHTGGEAEDGFVTALALTGGLDVRTARSRSQFAYTPTYYYYSGLSAPPDELNHIDHRYRGIWSVSPGARSTFAIRQGFSENTRQTGFTDLDGAGSEAGQPIIGQTRRQAWEIEPEWDMQQSARTTVSLRGLYRSEDYDDDTLVDTNQYGTEGALRTQVGRGQTVGGRLRGDNYQYTGGDSDAQAGFDRFFSAYVSWSLTVAERFELAAAAGAFRATGEEVDSSLGPVADLSGSWRWRRSSLVLAYNLGYSSGGGLSSADRSHRGDAHYEVRWGDGFAARASGTYIQRSPVEQDGGPTLTGRSFVVGLEKTWYPGWGLAVGISSLRQQQEVGRDLAYGEASVGFLFRPPVRPDRPVQAPPSTPKPQ